MDFIVRVNIVVNGLAEESETEMDKILREGYVKAPDWVNKSHVRTIKGLNCYEAVRELLLNGTPSIEVARQIQLLNELKHVSLNSIRVYVEHFKATLPKLEMIQRINPLGFVAAAKKVEKAIDSLSVLEKMIEAMVSRIEIGMKREAAMQFLMPGMNKEFETIKNMIQAHHEMKRNIIGRTDIEMITDAPMDWSKVYSAPNVNEVMQSPEKRARLVRMTENLTKMYGTMTPEQQQRVMDLAKHKLEERGNNEN
jgi:hypothetical protein